MKVPNFFGGFLQSSCFLLIDHAAYMGGILFPKPFFNLTILLNKRGVSSLPTLSYRKRGLRPFPQTPLPSPGQGLNCSGGKTHLHRVHYGKNDHQRSFLFLFVTTLNAGHFFDFADAGHFFDFADAGRFFDFADDGHFLTSLTLVLIDG